jgi:prepilin-type processing-associated H-X9-DG protein
VLVLEPVIGHDTISEMNNLVELLESLVPGLVIVIVCLLTIHFTRPHRHESKFRISLMEGLALASIVIIIAAIVYPSGHPLRERGGSPSCLSNVKQLGIGILMYLQDFDDRFPPAPKWGDAADPYLKNHYLFKCPKATNPYGYAFNKYLNLLPRKKVKDEKMTVMIFEANATSMNATGGKGLLVPQPRHDGKNVFGFVDGHAEMFARDAAVKWEP